jgi:hypothetical protein
VLAVPDDEIMVPMIFGADAMRGICLAGHELAVDLAKGQVSIDEKEVPKGINDTKSSSDVVCASGKALRVWRKINNAEVKSLFDTGCSLTFISRSTAQQLAHV